MLGRRRLVGWLPLIQIMIATALVVIAGWLAGASRHHAVSTTRLPGLTPSRPTDTPVKPPPSPPYTFPHGGRTLFPDYRLIALYGTPGEPVLGVLGEQSMQAAIARTKAMAVRYQPLMDEHALPTMEIITTVASAYPTDDNDYSREVASSKLLPWIEAAEKQGVYVVLDLQSGRSDFLKQAKQYRSLLLHPNVGLALDPEWRLTPHQVPLEQIGTVSIREVNQTADWLAELVRDNKLPQKLFLLHQFRMSMITDRALLHTGHTELAYALQMDGQGSQAAKLDTWTALKAGLPEGVRLGWKNFYDEDSPMRSPQATMELVPKPWYVSYQ